MWILKEYLGLGTYISNVCMFQTILIQLIIIHIVKNVWYQKRSLYNPYGAPYMYSLFEEKIHLSFISYM